MIDLGIVTPVADPVARGPRPMGAHRHHRRRGGASPGPPTRWATTTSRAASTWPSPPTSATTRGARYWDPLATLGYLAAVTERIRLVPSVVVLGYHHPLAIVKRYGTLDQVSRGRLVLGVGVGSLAEEFELLGAPFDDRGARADEALRAIRASMSTERSSFAATVPRVDRHARRTERGAGPRADLGRGRTGRSLRRAVELADGWAPFGLGTDDVAELLARARADRCLGPS